MSEENAKKTLGELMGTLDAGDGKGRKGCIRLQMIKKQQSWGDRSENQPYFYIWKGTLKITATKDILHKIVLPIIKFAVMVGGVGRGWRRPLHIFCMNNGKPSARGSHLILTHRIKQRNSNEFETKSFGLRPNLEEWNQQYQTWLDAVKSQWSSRFELGKNNNLKAEVFSPQTCAVYIVPAPEQDPINREDLEWDITNPVDTRGLGMELIYDPDYKRKIDVGGSAGVVAHIVPG